MGLLMNVDHERHQPADFGLLRRDQARDHLHLRLHVRFLEGLVDVGGGDELAVLDWEARGGGEEGEGRRGGR